MSKITKISVISIIYALLFGVPVFYLKSELDSTLILDFAKEMAVVVPVTIALFYLISLIPYLGILFIAILSIIGVTSNFFIFNFRKGFDEGVLNDLLAVEAEQTAEYINMPIIVSAFIGFILIYSLLHKYLHKDRYRESKKLTACILVLCTIVLSFPTKGFTNESWGYTLVNYLPYNLVWAVRDYSKKYSKHRTLLNNKLDLSTKHSFEFNAKDNDPLTVVMIIGESMRGSIISPRNMPLIHSRDNVVFFKNATSATTATRESLPFMLTSATFPDIEGSLGEKSFISIFKSLGFETSWIGNQGLYSFYESPYASIALEADHVITNMDLRKIYRELRTVDGHLVPQFINRLSQYQGDSLTVLHLNGSHWRFDLRLPKDFDAPFKPECNQPAPCGCSKESLMNSYENSLYYTDIVIDQLLEQLENKNAIVIYASDHGFSLGENGFWGNASKELLAQEAQTDIAMFAWFSKDFLEKRPNMLKNIEGNSSSSSSHDNIFHSILDCSGVESSYINQSLSLCRYSK